MIKLRIPAGTDAEVTLEQIRFTLQRHQGNAEVLIYMPEGKILRTTKDLWAEPSEVLKNQLMAILGSENVKIQ